MKYIIKIFENILTFYYFWTMDIDFANQMLIPHETNSGRRIYVTTIMISYMFTFISMFGFTADFLAYACVFVIGGIFALFAQWKNFYFNDWGTGICFRITFIIIMCYITSQFTHVKPIKNGGSVWLDNPDAWRFIYVSAPLTLMASIFVGGLLSIPFKVIAWSRGFLKGDFYLEPRNVTYDIPVNQSKSKVLIGDFEIYNETQLNAMLQNAIRDEDYREAERIRNYLDKKFPQ